jgi:uncharacterized protein YaeQ
MKDRRMDELLRTLPKERAREDFTSGLIQRLDSGAPPRQRMRFALAMAAAAVLLAAASIGVWWWQQSDKEELKEQIAQLRVEHQALTQELSQMRRQSTSIRPVLYLGGDERMDYVLDLNKLVRRRQAGSHEVPIKYTGGPI